MAEDILEIADFEDKEDVQRARLRIDARKWLMASKRYGDKLAIGGDADSGPLAAFRPAQNGVVGELEKTFTGSNGTESGRSDWKDSFNENASPQHMHDAIETAMQMLSSRVETYNNGWDHAMRSKNQFPLLTPNSIKALKGIGFDTDTLEGRTAAAPSSPKPNGDGSVSINGYNIRKL